MDRPPRFRTERLPDSATPPDPSATASVPMPRPAPLKVGNTTSLSDDSSDSLGVSGVVFASTPPALQRYEMDEEIGAGGMGRVLEVTDKTLRRSVALKVMHGEDLVEQSRFALEAQITGQLDHPNVLPVYDYGVDDHGKPYFTMKLVRGHSSLADVMDEIAKAAPSARRWTFRRRVQVIQEVCRALHYAHMRGVLHRDIKPENIVLGGFGEVYLVDWGVAALDGQAQIRPVSVAEEQARVVRETDARNIVGTPLYMSPEVIKGSPANKQSDVYSLVAVLFEFLTLHHYLIDLPQEVPILIKRVNEDKRVAAEGFVDPIAGRVPRSLSVLCLRGLSLDPTQRFADPLQLDETLQRWLEGKNEVVCPGTCMQRGMNESRDIIDQHPFLVPLAIISASVLAIAWLIYATIFYLQHS